MKLLITGGAGFIGSHLARIASSAGNEVLIYDNFTAGKEEYLEGLNLTTICGDIREISSKIPRSFKPDYVFHLAAFGSVMQSIENPKQNFDVNVAGTLEVLDYCREIQVRRVLFSSTGGALMGDATPPVNENSLPRPISPYGASKLACEAYINCYSKCYGLDYTIFRFGNVLGTNCLHKRGVINAFYSKLKNRETIEIFGNVSRDFIYVKDLTHAMMNSLSRDESINQVFHLASGKEQTISELAYLIIKSARINDANIVMSERRVGEVERNFSDIRKAQNVLDLSNSKTIEEVIEEVISYLDYAS